MSALPDAKSSQPYTRSLSDVRHLAVVLILSALPAAAATAFPPTVLDDKNLTFLTLYVVTLPWSLAVSAIAAGFAGGWFGPNESKQVLAAAGILVASAVIGVAIAPGSPLEEHSRGGPRVAALIVFVVIGYALMYGWPMWFASFLVAAYVGSWVHQRSRRADLASVVSDAGLIPLSDEPSPSPSAEGVAIAAETPKVVPRSTGNLSFRHAWDESSRHVHDDDLAGLTKAELYQRAREVGIKGRSAMSKDQLLAALRSNTE